MGAKHLPTSKWKKHIWKLICISKEVSVISGMNGWNIWLINKTNNKSPHLNFLFLKNKMSRLNLRSTFNDLIEKQNLKCKIQLQKLHCYYYRLVGSKALWNGNHANLSLILLFGFNNKTKRISPQNSKQASIKTQSEQLSTSIKKKKTPLAWRGNTCTRCDGEIESWRTCAKNSIDFHISCSSLEFCKNIKEVV